jgi:hypothetical protein
MPAYWASRSDFKPALNAKFMKCMLIITGKLDYFISLLEVCEAYTALNVGVRIV